MKTVGETTYEFLTRGCFCPNCKEHKELYTKMLMEIGGKHNSVVRIQESEFDGEDILVFGTKYDNAISCTFGFSSLHKVQFFCTYCDTEISNEYVKNLKNWKY